MDGDLPPQLSHRSVSERLHFPRPHDGATTPVFDAWVAGDLEPPPIPDSGAKMKGEAVEPPPHIEQRRVMREQEDMRKSVGSFHGALPSGPLGLLMEADKRRSPRGRVTKADNPLGGAACCSRGGGGVMSSTAGGGVPTLSPHALETVKAEHEGRPPPPPRQELPPPQQFVPSSEVAPPPSSRSHQAAKTKFASLSVATPMGAPAMSQPRAARVAFEGDGSAAEMMPPGHYCSSSGQHPGGGGGYGVAGYVEVAHPHQPMHQPHAPPQSSSCACGGYHAASSCTPLLPTAQPRSEHAAAHQYYAQAWPPPVDVEAGYPPMYAGGACSAACMKIGPSGGMMMCMPPGMPPTPLAGARSDSPVVIVPMGADIGGGGMCDCGSFCKSLGYWLALLLCTLLAGFLGGFVGVWGPRVAEHYYMLHQQ